jgi:SnoaL-like protein
VGDREEIHDLVLAYCRAVDRLQYDDIRAVYAQDGIDHHTGFDGTADEFVAWLRGLLPRLDGTMHIVGNHLAEVVGDRAVSETYGTAVHWGTPADSPSLNFTSGFRYVDQLVREDGRWRVAERFALREWTRVDVGQRDPEGAGPRGSRDRSDPIYRVLDELTVTPPE